MNDSLVIGKKYLRVPAKYAREAFSQVVTIVKYESTSAWYVDDRNTVYNGLQQDHGIFNLRELGSLEEALYE